MPRTTLLRHWVQTLFAEQFPGRHIPVEPASA